VIYARGIDFAGGRPNPVAIKNAGFNFVMRYLTPGGPSLPGKELLRNELEGYQNQGISVCLMYETTANMMLAGWAGGLPNAIEAASKSLHLGYPTNKPIYFACDIDVQPMHYPVILDYLSACEQILGIGKVGLYGEFDLLEAVGLGYYLEQTTAWSHGRISNNAHIYQNGEQVVIDGVECDILEARKFDYGQYLRGEHVLLDWSEKGPKGENKYIVPVSHFNQVTLYLSITTGTGNAKVFIQANNKGITQIDVPLSKDVEWNSVLPKDTAQLTLQWDIPENAEIGIGIEGI
jgi:hypothetical protein